MSSTQEITTLINKMRHEAIEKSYRCTKCGANIEVWAEEKDHASDCSLIAAIKLILQVAGPQHRGF